MPHACVKCNKQYNDDAVVLNGCTCGSRMFLFVRNGNGKVREGLYRIDLHALLRPSAVMSSPALTISDQGKYEIDLVKALAGSSPQKPE